MTKYEQKCVNLNVEQQYDTFKDWLRHADISIENCHRLRSCSAEVYDLVNTNTGEVLYHVLKSYNTIVAFIDVRTDTLYDVLRLVYGYTSTSAQHIAKFSHDYGGGKWGCANTLRYYPV